MTSMADKVSRADIGSRRPPKRPPIPAQGIMTRAGLTHAYPWKPRVKR